MDKKHTHVKKMGNNINANLACVAWWFWSGEQKSQGGRRWERAVKLRGDWAPASSRAL